MKRHIFLFALLSSIWKLSAQEVPSVVAPDSALIGSEVELLVRGLAHHWSIEPDSSWVLLDSLGKPEEGSTRLRIMALDSGLLALKITAWSAASDTLETHSAQIEVAMPKAAPELEIEDIHEPLDPGWDYWGIALMALGALALGLGLLAAIRYFLSRSKRLDPATEPIENKVDPYAEALEKLSALKSEKAWLSLAPREFYTLATDVYRVYLKKAIGLDALERSNMETFELLELRDWKAEDVLVLRALMHRSDLAKYADEQIKENRSEDLDLLERILGIHEQERRPSAEEPIPTE